MSDERCICDWDKRQFCGCFRKAVCGKPAPEAIELSDPDFERFEGDLKDRPLATNLSAQRLIRKPKRWS